MQTFPVHKASILRLALSYVAILATIPYLQSQNSINSAGKTATGLGGTATYSIGQVVYTTYSGSTGTIAQGVQHAYEIFTTGVEDVEFDIKMSVYPNPSSDQLTLKISDYISTRFTWYLYDLHGKLISKEVIVSDTSIINTHQLIAGTFILFVKDDSNKIIQSFKIIKS